MTEERYSVKVLRDCIELQNKKGSDYQNAVSSVKQADYYRLGLNTIYDIMHAKMLRMRSLLETAEANPDVTPNFESISDSAKDLINYASFFSSYAEGKMDGQNPDHDIFNRPKKLEVYKKVVEEEVPGFVSTKGTGLDEKALNATKKILEDHPELRIGVVTKGVLDDLNDNMKTELRASIAPYVPAAEKD